MTELVNCLNSLYENVVLNASDELENDVIEVLDEILKVLSSPQVDQVVFSSRIALKAKRKDFVWNQAYDFSLWYRMLLMHCHFTCQK